jgi:hypothetical protein
VTSDWRRVREVRSIALENGKEPLMLTVTLAVLFAAAAGGADTQDTEAFATVYRHAHYFLIWNPGEGSPQAKLDGVGYSRYTDGLAYRVINARNEVLVDDEIPRETSVEIRDLPCSPLYLLYAEPGFNGVRLRVDRAYGIVADQKHRLGLNAPKGRLFFYVPPECERFRVVAQSVSPREGGRVEVVAPDGKVVGVADGELDDPTVVKVSAAREMRGRVWSLVLKPPTAEGLFLDDLNVHLEGDLPCLVVPRADWARDLIPTLPRAK